MDTTFQEMIGEQWAQVYTSEQVGHTGCGFVSCLQGQPRRRAAGSISAISAVDSPFTGGKSRKGREQSSKLPSTPVQPLIFKSLFECWPRVGTPWFLRPPTSSTLKSVLQPPYSLPWYQRRPRITFKSDHMKNVHLKFVKILCPFDLIEH